MNKIGLFYGGTSNGSTYKVAKKIQEALGKNVADLNNIAYSSKSEIEKYTNLIFGTSAWGIGDMHRDWEGFIDEFSEVDFSDKVIALFGLGDQKTYPESYLDGTGTIFCRLPNKENIIGFWPTDGYSYYYSSAEKDGQFVGLAIDEDTQPDKTDDRIKQWVEQIKDKFK